MRFFTMVQLFEFSVAKIYPQNKQLITDVFIYVLITNSQETRATRHRASPLERRSKEEPDCNLRFMHNLLES